MSPSDRPKPPNTGKGHDWPDPDDPPTDEELRAADALRWVLEGEHRGHANEDQTVAAGARAQGEFARSLRAAVLPQSLADERHRQMVDRALAAKPHEARSANVVEISPAAPEGRSKKRPPIVVVALGAGASLLAMAAGVVLLIRVASPERPMAAKGAAERVAPALAFSRSTAELFPEGFPRSGGTTDRVDRIALARAQDFRQNRFARWGAP